MAKWLGRRTFNPQLKSSSNYFDWFHGSPVFRSVLKPPYVNSLFVYLPTRRIFKKCYVKFVLFLSVIYMVSPVGTGTLIKNKMAKQWNNEFITLFKRHYHFLDSHCRFYF